MFKANPEFPTFFANGSFFFLFLAMAWYWVDLAFLDSKKKPLIATGFGKWSILLANLSLIALLCIRWFDSGHFPLSNLYESLMFLSWSCTSIHLFLIFCFGRREAPSSLPVIFNGSNSSQSNTLIEPAKFHRFGFRAERENQNLKLLGCVATTLALFLNAFATFSLPKEMQLAGPLVPALQSNWLMMHVTVMIISYAALILGSLLSIVFVIASRLANFNKFLRARANNQSSNKNTSPLGFAGLNINKQNSRSQQSDQIYLLQSNNGGFDLPPAESPTPLASSGLVAAANPKASIRSADDLSALRAQFKNSTDNPDNNGLWPDKQATTQSKTNSNIFFENIDYLSYRIIGIGFPFLTIGILSGAVWANEAWGSYWSWDPKETWALLTWLVFAIYLHTRLTKGWDGEKPALIASLGFVVVWVCYLGVNLLGEGLHSYGFFAA